MAWAASSRAAALRCRGRREPRRRGRRRFAAEVDASRVGRHRHGVALDLRGERGELGAGLGKFDLELGRIEPLGLGDEDATAQKLKLLLELLVGASQLVALGGYLRERRLQMRDTVDEPLPVGCCALEHGAACNHPRDRCPSIGCVLCRISALEDVAGAWRGAPPARRRATLRASRHRPPRDEHPATSARESRIRGGPITYKKCACRCHRRKGS